MPGREDILNMLTNATRQPLLQGMGEPGGSVKYGQGRILSWNAATFENQIAYRGGVITDMAVLSGPDALTYQPGDIVGVSSWAPQGGATVYWIMGRIIIPGPDRGAETIAWMTSELGKAIAAAVFAERIESESDFATGIRTSAGFGDLVSPIVGPPPPAAGPSVTMDISSAGKALVYMTAGIQCFLLGSSGDNLQQGYVGVELSGSNTRSAATGESLEYRIGDSAVDTQLSGAIRVTHLIEHSELDPGTTKFKLVYANGISDDPDDTLFSNRNITVIGL